jgi:ankyrin repeat protein
MNQREDKLLTAVKNGDNDLARLLIEKGADLNAKDDYQYTPLHWAAKGGHTTLARLLIEKGADLNTKDERKQTPLHWAAMYGHIDLARLLIEKGADLNAKDDYQYTPLHWAAENGDIDLTRLLIEKGADLNARDAKQWTPLHWAAENGHAAAARLLIEKGADPTLASASASTARQVAEVRGHLRIAEHLATSERWHVYVKPVLGPDNKLDARKLVDEAGQPTEALKNLLHNELFAELARPEFYRQGFNDLVLVYPHLPKHVQASIDLTPYRRSKIQEANERAEPDGGWLKRFVRPSRASTSEKRRGNDEPQVGR